MRPAGQAQLTIFTKVMDLQSGSTTSCRFESTHPGRVHIRPCNRAHRILQKLLT